MSSVFFSFSKRGQLLFHIFKAQQLVHDLVHRQAAGIVAGVVLGRLGAHLAVDKVFVVVQIAAVGGHA